MVELNYPILVIYSGDIMKKQEIKITELLNVVKPSYAYLKLTPNNSVRNNATEKVAKSIALLYANIWKTIQAEETKILNFFGKDYFLNTKYSIKSPAKVLFYAYLTKEKTEFYFVMPKQHLSVLTEKMRDTWLNLTIEEVDHLPLLSKNASMCEMLYQKEDALSLAVDARNNDLLASNLNVLNILEDTDRVAIAYNFVPMNQFPWPGEYKNTLQKVKRKESVDKNKVNILYGLQLVIKLVNDTLNLFTDLISPMDSKKQKAEMSLLDITLAKLNNGPIISDATSKKANQHIVRTEIILQSESDNKLRQKNNLKSLASGYDSITEDNALIPHQRTKSVNLDNYVLSDKFNKMSTAELSNFIALPGRELLTAYKSIDKISTLEQDLDKDLRTGKMCIGRTTYLGNSQNAYLTEDKDYKYLALVIIGPSRAGKSTLIANLSNDCVNAGECVIIFDFCRNADLSDDVAMAVGQDKVLSIDCQDFTKMQGFGYNEVEKSEDVFEQYRNAKEQAMQLILLINSINSIDKALAPKMERYLEAACLVVFIVNGPVKDVFGVLQSHSTRHKYINNIPIEQLENLEEYALNLLELDEYSKNKQTDEMEVSSTKHNSVAGIIDRLSKLKQNVYLELSLKKDCKNNIDLTKEVQKNQVICLRMPEKMFKTKNEKDIYCTYWITKIWLALQMRSWNIPDREKLVKLNIVIDELYQVPCTEAFITDKISQIAKFGAKVILSCHYINQLKYLRDELRSANGSYMLISGCDKKNFDELKSELSPFVADDLLHLAKHHSLNYIKTSEGYARFITELPKPVKPKKQENGKKSRILKKVGKNCVQITDITI